MRSRALLSNPSAPCVSGLAGHRPRPAARLWVALSALLVLLGAVTGPPQAVAGPAPTPAGSPDGLRPAVAAAFSRLPIYFEANHGQADPAVRFLARGGGAQLALTATEAVIPLRSPAPAPGNDAGEAAPAGTPAEVRLRLLGANPTPAVTGEAALPGRVHYFLGDDPAQWHTQIPTYARVRYTAVYPGIDLVYHGTQRALEYDFLLAPGADPAAITLAVDGAQDLTVDAQGDLVVRTAAGELRQHRPVLYQEGPAGRQPVAGGYVLKGERQVGFRVEAYDATRPLVIDPVVVWSSFWGGQGDDSSTGIAVDPAGNVYVTGSTTVPGRGDTDAFVLKVAPDGSTVLYAAYLGNIDGRACNDAGRGIAVDETSQVYVTGFMDSGRFCQTRDAFVAKLDAGGQRIYSRPVVSATEGAEGLSIALEAGEAYVVGEVGSPPNFPTVPFQKCLGGAGSNDVFVAKVNAAGTGLVYATCLGFRSGVSIEPRVAVHAGEAYVVGSLMAPDVVVKAFQTTPGAFQPLPGGGYEAFIAKVRADGAGLVYASYLGGTGWDQAHGITVDATGQAYIVGRTASNTFPTTEGALDRTCGTDREGRCNLNLALVLYWDAFVTKVNAAGSALIYSTFVGGSGDDVAKAIAVDEAGQAYVAVVTGSRDLLQTYAPLPSQPLQAELRGNAVDSGVVVLNAAGSQLRFATFLGGSAEDDPTGIALDAAGDIYVTGVTKSADFPTTPGAFQQTYGGARDAFVTKIGDVHACNAPAGCQVADRDSFAPALEFTAVSAHTAAVEARIFAGHGCTALWGTASGEVPVAAGQNTIHIVFEEPLPLGTEVSMQWTVGACLQTGCINYTIGGDPPQCAADAASGRSATRAIGLPAIELLPQ